jgi:hypothetical protein
MPQVFGHDDVRVDVSVNQTGLGGGTMRHASSALGNTCDVLTNTSKNLSNSENSGLRGSTVFPFVVDLSRSGLQDQAYGVATIGIDVSRIKSNKTSSPSAIAEWSNLTGALPAPPPRLPAPPRSPR